MVVEVSFEGEREYEASDEGRFQGLTMFYFLTGVVVTHTIML
jgi:hypothetical protein